MEKKITLFTNDNHNIYGLLNYKGSKSDSLVIFVHGLAANMNSHFFFNGSKYLVKMGYTTFRFNFYSSKERGRLLSDCSIQDHIDDLNTVIDHFKNKFSRIYLIGHSLGGPVCINSNHKNLTAMCLWDPALLVYGMKRDSSRFVYNKKLDKYIFKTDSEIILSKQLVENSSLVDTRIIPKISIPIKIISASDFPAKNVWRLVFNKIKADKKDFVIIENSNHTFDFEGNEEELFKQTHNWLLSF